MLEIFTVYELYFVALISTGLHSKSVNIMIFMFTIFKKKSFSINICKAKTKKDQNLTILKTKCIFLPLQM